MKTIALQNTEEALLFTSPKKKKDLKSISSLNVRGDIHIHITMQHVILTKIFKPAHPPTRNVKMNFYVPIMNINFYPYKLTF